MTETPSFALLFRLLFLHLFSAQMTQIAACFLPTFRKFNFSLQGNIPFIKFPQLALVLLVLLSDLDLVQ